MIAVIGDVHGCFFTFEALYNKVSEKYPGVEIFCVGDLVDRGSNSFEVVQFLIDNSIRFTPGNHDYMFYAYFREPDSLFARSWVFNGNEATLRSYLKHYDSIGNHIDFVKSAPLYYNLDDCFISHAGISEKFGHKLPGNFLENGEFLNSFIYAEYMSDSGVLWTRDRLLNLGKLQVVGHTKQNEVRLDPRANAVYIDTGACLDNKLSAVVIHNSEIIEVLSERTHPEDVQFTDF